MKNPKLIIPIVFALVGVLLLVNTFAKSNDNSTFFEAESAQGIAKSSDTTASNNGFIAFKESSTGGGTTGGSSGLLPSWVNPSLVQRVYIQCLNDSGLCINDTGSKIINGTSGNDLIDFSGYERNWKIDGGAGDDVIIVDGGSGEEVAAWGGSGKDTFVINRGFARTVIQDLASNEDVYILKTFPYTTVDQKTPNNLIYSLQTQKDGSCGVEIRLFPFTDFLSFRPQMAGIWIRDEGTWMGTCPKLDGVSFPNIHIDTCPPFAIQKSWIDKTLPSNWSSSGGLIPARPASGCSNLIDVPPTNWPR